MNIKQPLDLSHLMDDPNFDPEQLGARFWYEQFLKQQAKNQQQHLEIQQLHDQLSQLQAEVDQLKEALRKLY